MYVWASDEICKKLYLLLKKKCIIPLDDQNMNKTPP